jgi:hypothetical protein
VSLARPALALLLGVLLACSGDTSRLTPEQESQFATEGIRRRAANVWFRYTHDAGTRSAGWEDRLASIVVTNQRVFVYKNQKIGIEITATSRRFYEVNRERARVRLGAGSGQSREVWSFEPPDDPMGWTEDIRAVIRLSKSSANR